MKGRKTGGRQKGARNKVGADVRALAQQYTKASVQLLADTLTNDEAPLAVRLVAARELLDRGHGRPSQALEHSGELHLPVSVVDVFHTD